MVAAACGRHGSRASAAGLARSDVARATGDGASAPAVASVNGFGLAS
jgi:hypothetical protein